MIVAGRMIQRCWTVEHRLLGSAVHSLDFLALVIRQREVSREEVELLILVETISRQYGTSMKGEQHRSLSETNPKKSSRVPTLSLVRTDRILQLNQCGITICSEPVAKKVRLQGISGREDVIQRLLA